jgi:hypothetical protein
MSSFVYGLAVIDCFFAVFLWRDAWFDFLVGQQGSDFVAVIAAITNQGFCLGQVLEQDIRTLEVAALSFGQVKPDGPPEVITQGMQLCVQPPLGPPNQSWLVAPFLRLEAVRWAFR